MSPEDKADEVISIVRKNKEFFVEFLKNQTVQAKSSDPGDAISDRHYIHQWYYDRDVFDKLRKNSEDLRTHCLIC